MTLMITRRTRRTAIATLLFLGPQLCGPAAWAQAPSPPASGAPKTAGAPTKPATPAVAGSPAEPPEATGNRPWPRQATEEGRTLTVYQPQVEKWDGTRLHFRAAFSVESAASPVERFGVVWFSARAEVDKISRLVGLTNFKVDRVAFPSEPDRAAEYQKFLERRLPRDVARISLDRVQAELAITEAQSTAAAPKAVKNDPPRIIFSTTPALLVLVDGKSVYRQVEGSSLQRVVNTWAVILVDKGSGKHYLRALGVWFEASTLDGPWAPAAKAPATLGTALQTVAKSQRVNLLDDPGSELKEGAARGVLPNVHVSTVPAELVQTLGRPDYEPLEGTDLLHVRNSSANILLDTTDQRHYLLVSGRWFRSASLMNGPWEYVAHDKLPAAFAKISETHPRGAVLASVPGTPQAKEALIDNSIPQTAEVDRKAATYQATYDGAPKFQPVEGTSLHYAANSPAPVIQVSPTSYYALQNGIWFVAPTPQGFWEVATTVPPVVYTIPVSSPLYYVTHVHVYSATPQTVYVGYTPGYYGTVVAPTSVVVYGTGYVYPPVYVGAYWYPPPVTYGYGAGFAWGAFTGFAFGAIAAGAWGGAWGCCHHHHGDIDINRNVNINRSNAYSSWNQGQVRSNLESRGQSAQARATEARQGAQQRATEARQGAQQAAQERSSARSNDVYAGRDGSTYRRGAEGWEQNGGQGWDRANFGGAGESATSLNSQQRARSTGAARESSYQRSGGGGGSSYSGGARASGGGARAGGGGGRRR